MEAKRWFLQSLRDLKAAKDSFKTENYEWASFQAQQSAEKAVKALLYGLGIGVLGHLIVELLDMLKEQGGYEIIAYARELELDRHYIPSRYPNSYESIQQCIMIKKQLKEQLIIMRQ